VLGRWDYNVDNDEENQRQMMRVLIAGVAMVASLGALSVAGWVQETTVKDGVYTTGQAARGRERYEASCQRCHGADLTGGAGRSLTGVVFLRDWTGLTLDGLFERMQSMPPDGSENLSAKCLCRHHQLCARAERVPGWGGRVVVGATD